MVDLKAWGANLLAPGSGFLVKAFDKAKEWKDNAVKAAKAAKDKLSAGKTVVAGAAAATVVQSGYEPPKGKVWAQPAVVFIVAFFLFLYLRFIGLKTVANYILITAACPLIFGVIFKEPKKGYIVLSLPAFIWILETFKMLTPANTIFAAGTTATLVLVAFEKTRDFAGKVLTVGVFLLGGILIFWLSTWAQTMMKISFPFIITFFLLISYFIYILTRPGKWKWLALIVNFLFFFVILVTPTVVSLPDSPFYTAIEAQRQGMFGVYNSIVGAGKQVYKGVINVNKNNFKSTSAEDLANKGTADPAGAEDHNFFHCSQIRSDPRSVSGTIHNRD
jgi:hypothetical protein